MGFNFPTDLATTVETTASLVTFTTVLHMSSGLSIANIKAKPASGIPACPKTITNITIPANTSAEIYLPVSNQKSISESGKNIVEAEGVQFIRQDGNKLIYQIKSGNYAFQIKL